MRGISWTGAERALPFEPAGLNENTRRTLHFELEGAGPK